MSKIKIAIVGVGNCASSLIQGLEYFKNNNEIIGSMHSNICGYYIDDIDVVIAFDVDKRKVGISLACAIFEPPNCTKEIVNQDFFSRQISDVIVMKAPVFDGISDHMKSSFLVDEHQIEMKKEEILNVLKETQTQIIINYLPVGSQIATEFWADIAISAGCAFINCIPVFIASDSKWINKFMNANLPIIGDDIKSQCGATILHRAIVNMLVSRGASIDSTWQTNIGGNTDFRNMLDGNRLISKKISKTESISSQIPYYTPVYAGPNGYIESLKDNKICNIRADFRIFGGISCSIDCRLSVEDSPNSAGVVVDAIRVAKVALDKKIGGYAPSAYFMKHPPVQMSDEEAKCKLEEFINEE